MADLPELERDRMVRIQIQGRGIQNHRVISAMQRVPRHFFVPSGLQVQAYGDFPLPIGDDQTISQPYIVAFMTELLDPLPGEKILEIGTGSGYQAAVLAAMDAQVISLERIPELVRHAEENLKRVGIGGIRIICTDGTEGYSGEAPYDGILITAAAPHIPEVLFGQIRDGGRIVAPVGSRDIQELIRITRVSGIHKTERFFPVRFVPLIGADGWEEEPV